MEDALKLEGYLMKEKSKLSRLHGLTGDINKRYFRIRTIEGSEELALCYYKNTTDPEVRGWIYLRDVTEIAEHQDTIILTSVARTLHLYAQTRAEHSLWVAGLAKLCPDAFTMLGRKSSVVKTPHDVAPTSSASSSTNAKLLGKSPTSDDRQPQVKLPAVDIVEVPQTCESVDKNKVSSPSNRKADKARAECFRTPRGDDKWSRRRSSQHLDKNSGIDREAGERRASWSADRSDSHGLVSGEYVGNDGRTELVEGPHRRCSSNGEREQQRSISIYTERKDRDEKERIRSRKSKIGKPGRHPREGRAHRLGKADTTENGSRVKETAVSPTSAVRFQPPCRRKSLEESDARTKGRENADEEKSIESENEDLPTTELDATGLKDVRSGTDGHERVVHAEIDGDGCTKESRVYSSDNEQVETIELGEGTRHVTIDGKELRAIDKEQQNANRYASAGSVVGCTNQEESEGGDEDVEIDIEVPQLVLGNVEGRQQGQSATSRLHRHILQPDAEADKFNGSVPPPKEFLKQPPLKPVGIEPREAEKCPDETIPVDVPKSVSHRRRRSAADLEWSDGGGTPDRPRCLEEKMAQVARCGPVDLGDSENDGEDDLDVEVEKQRRRAAAALSALEAAAKEADEGAQVESQAPGESKRRGSLGARRPVAKAIPSPAEPPPPALVRKGRRGHGVPPPGVAPPKVGQPSVRIKSVHRQTDDENFLRDDWDDEVKTPSHGSPVPVSRDAGSHTGANIGLLQNRENQWMHFDD